MRASLGQATPPQRNLVRVTAAPLPCPMPPAPFFAAGAQGCAPEWAEQQIGYAAQGMAPLGGRPPVAALESPSAGETFDLTKCV